MKLSDTHQQIRETTRRFAQEVIRPITEELLGKLELPARRLGICEIRHGPRRPDADGQLHRLHARQSNRGEDAGDARRLLRQESQPHDQHRAIAAADRNGSGGPKRTHARAMTAV